VTRYKKDNWTRKLIDDAATFMKNKKHIDHYAMQLLTGHIFNYYMKRINKENSKQNWQCKADPDDAEHALLKRPRWIVQRTAIENRLGENINIGNLINQVTTNDNIWKQYKIFCGTIMKARQDKEKEIELSKKRRNRE
jgi:hypothetical protein